MPASSGEESVTVGDDSVSVTIWGGAAARLILREWNAWIHFSKNRLVSQHVRRRLKAHPPRVGCTRHTKSLFLSRAVSTPLTCAPFIEWMQHGESPNSSSLSSCEATPGTNPVRRPSTTPGGGMGPVETLWQLGAGDRRGLGVRRDEPLY